MIDLILVVTVLFILVVSVWFLRREKKKGNSCVGCSSCCSCNHNCKES